MTLTTAHTSRLAVLMFTDIVGSVELKSRLGTPAYARLLARHDELFKRLLAEYPGAEIVQDTGDGYFATFATVSDAVRHALRFQDAMHREPWGPHRLEARVGIHFGELSLIPDRNDAPGKVIGIAADLAARLMALAGGGQILLSRAAFDEARQFVAEHPHADGDGRTPGLRWMAHGDYEIQGLPEPVTVFEVGGQGVAPLAPPPNGPKARRAVAAGEEILGWRPAVGLAVPQAAAWVLEGKLGEGTFGEVWLARHQQLKQHRVFKFCFDAARLESFKRELTLFRLLQDALGDRPDIARLYDVCLDRPPYFLESEYAPDGNLIAWSDAQGGLAAVPLDTRLDIVARICDATAAAHSVGVLHKDIKPSNVLIHVGRDGAVRPQLADFGIGLLTDHSQLSARQITEVGFTMTEGDASSRTGTRMYAPPESLAGRPFTTQGDIYALGVLLYQMTIGDLERPLAPGWERDVGDELLREDIAACVDGDPGRRRHSAAEIASCLRKLPERRARRAAERQAADATRRRRRLLRAAAFAAAAVVTLASIAVVGFVRERGLRVQADNARLEAEGARRQADAARRDAELAFARGMVDQATTLHAVGRIPDSRQYFVQGRAKLAQLGEPTLAAEVGLSRSFRRFDSPINTIDNPGGTMSVVWLPDGTRFVSAGDDGVIRCWDAPTGRLLQPLLRGHKGLVAAVAVSPDGKRLLSGGADQTLRLWDLADGSGRTLFTEPAAQFRGVAFSPDGRRALSASSGDGAAVRLWDIDAAREIRTLGTPARRTFYGVGFSPDGTRALATTYQDDAWIWDLTREGAPPVRLEGHTGDVIAATFSPDGRHVISASFDHTLRRWDAATGRPLPEPLTGHSAGVRGAAFVGADGGRVLSASMDGTLKLWDLHSGQALRTFVGHTKGVRGLAVSPDGSRAVSGGEDDTLAVWDLRSSAAEVPSADDPAVVTALWTDGATLVSGDAAGTITLRDLATLRTLNRLHAHDNAIECAVLLDGGRRLFTADRTGRAVLWDAAERRPISEFARRLQTINDTEIRRNDWCYTSVTPDGRVAISSAADGLHLEVWSPATGAKVRLVGPHSYPVTCLAIAPDGTHALAGDMRGDVYHWDLATGELRFKTPSASKAGRVDCVTFAVDGKAALAGGHDNLVRLLNLEDRGEARRFAGHTFVVRTVGFGRDGATVLSAGSDRTLRMFDAKSGREYELDAQFDLPVNASAVVPPGDAVVAASGRTVGVWDLSRGARHVDEQPRLAAARERLRADGNDAGALLTLGRWYAFRGVDDWSAALLERARAAGAADVPALTLARCYWRLGDRANAARAFRQAAAANEAPPAYLGLCLAAVEGEPDPTSRPATADARPVAPQPNP